MQRWRRTAIAFALGVLSALLWWFGHSSSSIRSVYNGSKREGRAILDDSAKSSSPPRALSITGRVSNRSTGAIAGASVCLTCGDCYIVEAPEQTRCSNTDEAGEFRFDAVHPGHYRLSATAAGFVPAVYQKGRPFEVLDRARDSCDLELESQGALLAGTVVDATGGPVPGAQLRVHFGEEWLNGGSPFEQRAQADEDGRFAVWVAPSQVGVLASAEGYAGASVLAFAPSNDVRLVLTPGARISGTVVSSSDGEPVEGVVVTATSDTGAKRRGTSDADGAFTVDGLRPGTYGLQASAQGWLGRASGSITLDLGEEKRGVVVAVAQGVRVRGKVLIGDRACSASALQLEPAPGEAGPRLHAYGRPSGAIEIEAVPPARYIPRITCRGYESRVGEPLDVVNTNIDHLVWRFDAGATVRVRTITAGGKPAPGVQLTLGPPPTQRTNKPELVDYKQVSTSEEGVASFTGVKPGEHIVHAPPNGESKAVRVLANETIELTLTVVPMGSIDVLVRDRKGRPNDRVAVSAEPLERGKGLVGDVGSSRGGGRYRIGPLLAGAYKVDVRDRSNPTQLVDEGRPVVVRAGEVSTVDAIYGGEEGQITGRVLNAQNRPMPDVWVSATHTTEEADPYRSSVLEFQETRTLTNADGRFSLEELSANAAFTVHASHSLGGKARVENIKPGAHVELTLSEPGKIRGIARSKDGNPPDYFKVAVTNQAQEQSLFASFSPDAKGHFEVAHIAPGEIEVIVQTPSELSRAHYVLTPGQVLEGLVFTLAPPEFAQLAPPNVPNAVRQHSEPKPAAAEEQANSRVRAP